MGFFDDSHVTDVGLQGSLGPSVGFTEMLSQGFRQQFRVDSGLALHNELQNRWLRSLRAANIEAPEARTFFADPWGINALYSGLDPDPGGYVAMAQRVSGAPATDTYGLRAFSNDPNARIKGMIEANEKIKALNDPNIRSFEQILEEVSAMQQGVEEETASMSERGGTKGTIAALLGAIGGSFTARDPLNIITAPLGAGRTAFTRIASEMGLAAAVTGYTELTEVGPARELAGLPERNPLYNIAAATIGAGIIRGGIEGIGYGIGRLRGEDIDFDLRDSQLQQMFEANAEKPSARAGLKLLDDTQFIERNNPYGEGRAAQERFIAELQQIQRVMGGEPMTSVARALPPVPFDYIKKAADFEIVKEQAPQVYARMETAQAKLARRSQPEVINEATLAPQHTDAKGQLDINAAGLELRQRVKEALDEGAEVSLIVEGKSRRIIGARTIGIVDEQNQPWGAAAILMAKPGDDARVEIKMSTATAPRRAANAEYEAAYRDVEAEATRFREQQTHIEAAQQREAVGIFADATTGRPFNWSALQYDSVQARVDAINAFNETLDEKAVAAFVRQVEGEGEEAVEREVWRTEGGIDIGLREPVDPEFRISTDDGDMTVEAAMRDLQDDADLDDAMRTCLL